MNKNEICENCKHGSLSLVAADGQDIRESQYPPMIECSMEDEKYLKYPYDTCDNFKYKDRK